MSKAGKAAVPSAGRSGTRLAARPFGRLDVDALALLDAIGPAVYIVDKDGRCVFANERCVALLGVESVDALLGQAMHEIAHKRPEAARRSKRPCIVTRALEAGRVVHTPRDVLSRADGTPFFAECW